MPTSKNKSTKKAKSIDQLSVAKITATRLGLPVTVVVDVIEMEQKLTMEYVRDGYKVIKKNYITLTPTLKPGRIMKSKLDGKIYNVPEKQSIRLRIGMGFKAFVSNQKHKLPEKICRFVDKKQDLSNTGTLPLA